jgi:lysylphosphatidylglycerol synthetase-like protein (DUF2156 family)
LPLARRSWISFADLPAWETPHHLSSALFDYAPKGFVLRGCSPLLSETLLARGGRILCSGREALLDLQGDHFQRKTVRELVRRGLRHGEAYELKLLTSRHENAILTLAQKVSSTHPISLKHLYRDDWQAAERLFVFESSKREIWGLVSLSRNGFRSWHTEQLLRLPGSPVGMMAALLEQVFLSLQAEDEHWWSLGEVPFYPLVEPDGFKAQLFNRAGRALEEVYSAEGLLNFKAKFKPFWRPVYLYGSPDLNWRVLWDLFQASRCSRLAWRALTLRGVGLLGKGV